MIIKVNNQVPTVNGMGIIPPAITVVELGTDAEMTAVLTSANVGKAYKFVGTTGTYTNGDIYVVEASS